MARAQRTAIVVFARDDVAGPSGLSAVLARATAAAVARGASGADVLVASDGLADDLWPADFIRVAQRGADFEARFLGALREVAARGYERVVALGIDTPGLTASDVRRAVLDPGLVVGPARDGGFYLLGLDAARIEALVGLPWQTPRVLAALCARLGEGAYLAVRRDVDDPHDVEALFAVLDRLCRRYEGRALLRHRPRTSPERAAAVGQPAIHRRAHRAHAPPASA